MITSSRNPKVSYVRALLARPQERRENAAFVVEGVRLAEEALYSNWPASLVLFSEDLSERGKRVVQEFMKKGVETILASPEVLKSASDTQNPQGVILVMEQRELSLPVAPDFLLILDGIRDPGNMGSILRTAAAAGIEAVLLPPGGADVFAPKVLRAAMGAHFRLPILGLDWEEIQAILGQPDRRPRLNVYLADARGGKSYTQADFRSPCAFIIGGEAQGPGSAAYLLADERLHIPLAPGSESLNAAAATAIILFEAVRQRSQT